MLNPVTTLAYKVWELEVNVDNGHIIPVMTEDCSGGFIKKSKFFNCFGGVLLSKNKILTLIFMA